MSNDDDRYRISNGILLLRDSHTKPPSWTTFKIIDISRDTCNFIYTAHRKLAKISSAIFREIHSEKSETAGVENCCRFNSGVISS